MDTSSAAGEVQGVAGGATMRAERSTTEYLDGLRALLIVAVMMAHCFYLTGTRWYFAQGHQAGSYPAFFQPMRWFFPAFFAVSPFVVVSGYCLMLPVVRSKDRKLKNGVADYFLRRARRILPSYYAAVLLSVLHAKFFRADYQMWSDPWTAGNMLSHLFLFYNASDVWRYGINGPYWSLAPEWQLYILFPLVLIPLWRRVGNRGLLTFTFVWSALLMLSGAAICRMHPWFLFLFAVGVFVAAVTEAREGGLQRLRQRLPWGLIGSVLAAVIFVEWAVLLAVNSSALADLPPDWRTYAPNEMLLGLATGAALIHWTTVRRSVPPERWSGVLRLLHSSRVRWVGRFSFSLYLLHFPILVSTAALVVRLKLGLAATLLLSYTVSIPVALLLSYLFFLLVERRSLTGRRPETRPQLQSAPMDTPTEAR